MIFALLLKLHESPDKILKFSSSSPINFWTYEYDGANSKIMTNSLQSKFLNQGLNIFLTLSNIKINFVKNSSEVFRQEIQ